MFGLRECRTLLALQPIVREHNILLFDPRWIVQIGRFVQDNWCALMIALF